MKRPATPFLALLVACAAFGVSAPRSQVPAAQAPDAEFLAQVVVPVGGIIVWWGSENDVPRNFEVCDGRLVATQGALLTGRKPDLRDRFVKGTPLPNSFRTQNFKTGGSNTLSLGKTQGTVLTLANLPKNVPPIAHAHQFPHSHGMSKASLQHTHEHDHTHGLQTQSASASTGGGSTANFLQSVSAGGAFQTGAASSSTTSPGGPSADPTTGPPIDGQGNANPPTGPPIAPTGPKANWGSDVPHDHNLSATADNQPAFLEVLFIIRVK